MKYAAFLRGINTGKQNLKMKDLLDALEREGFIDPKAYLASGNLLLEDHLGGEPGMIELTADELKELISRTIQKMTGWDIGVILRSQVELDAILKDLAEADAELVETELAKTELAEAGFEPEGYHTYVLLTADEAVLGEVKTLYGNYAHGEGEKLFGEKSDFFWRVKIGDTLGGFGSKVLGGPKFKNRLTSRNINTIRKVRKAME